MAQINLLGSQKTSFITEIHTDHNMCMTHSYHMKNLTHYNKLSILITYADEYKDPSYITV